MDIFMTKSANDFSSDEVLEQKIKDELKWDNRIDASRISIQVNDGEVTLEGNVSRFYTKFLVEQNVWMISGVISLKNNLRVKPDKSGAVLNDDDIADRIKMIFFADNDLVTSKIDVEVEDGVVHLIGNVDAMWKKYYGTVRVSNVLGVKDVVNKLAVVPTEKRKDEEISREIMKAIDRREFVDGDNITVKVEDAKVELEGEVESRRAWKSSYDAVRFTQGVKQIEDNIKIEV
jgi:osmotically-inducible protein OsmY